MGLGLERARVRFEAKTIIRPKTVVGARAVGRAVG